MNALEIAECFELYACDHTPDGWPAIRQGTLNEAAAQLRRQHGAIVKLREALEGSVAYAELLEKRTYRLPDVSQIKSKQTLKETEDLK